MECGRALAHPTRGAAALAQHPINRAGIAAHRSGCRYLGPSGQNPSGRLLCAVSAARLDRSLMRGGRCARRQSDGVVGHANILPHPGQFGHHVGHEAVAGAFDLDRRIGLLRPKWFRRCIGRRGLAVAAGGQAGAGAMDAPPRAPMGAQGRGHGHVGQRRSGYRWKNCRLGLRGVEPQPRFAPLLRHGWQCVGRRGAGHARALFASRCRSRCQAHLRF